MCGEGRLWGEGRLGEVLLTVLSVLGLTGDLDLLFRFGDLLLRLIGLLLLRGDRDFLLGDLDFLRGDRVRLRLGLLGLSVRRDGLDLWEVDGPPFLEADRERVRLLRSEERLLSSDFMFTDIVPEPDTTLLSPRSLSENFKFNSSIVSSIITKKLSE